MVSSNPVATLGSIWPVSGSPRPIRFWRIPFPVDPGEDGLAEIDVGEQGLGAVVVEPELKEGVRSLDDALDAVRRASKRAHSSLVRNRAMCASPLSTIAERTIGSGRHTTRRRSKWILP